MAQSDVDRLGAAYEALARGEVEPLVSLLDPAVFWRGIERGVLWWRRAPT